MKGAIRAFAFGAWAVLLGATGSLAGAAEGSWRAQEADGIVRVAYGIDPDFPQYAALHLSSGYLRLVPTRDAGWGTSVVLMPALWTGGAYHQGAKVTTTTKLDEDDLLIDFSGSIAGLQVRGQVRLFPPQDHTTRATVAVNTAGKVTLDQNHPGEAFKPVMLSSMRISETQWDSQSAFAGEVDFPLPQSGWVVQPPAKAEVFGLTGGTSEWKSNAPTIEITLDEPRAITGWVTPSEDPNDDNVGLWAASDVVLKSWEYAIVAKGE